MSPKIAVTLTAVVILALIACSGPGHPPDPQNVPEADAEEIIREYIFNRERAKEAYEDRWFTVTAGPVARIWDGDQATVKYKNAYPAVLIFNDKEQAAQINRSEHLRAVCQFKGLTRISGNRAYKFDKCRWPDGPATN